MLLAPRAVLLGPPLKGEDQPADVVLLRAAGGACPKSLFSTGLSGGVARHRASRTTVGAVALPPVLLPARCASAGSAPPSTSCNGGSAAGAGGMPDSTSREGNLSRQDAACAEDTCSTPAGSGSSSRQQDRFVRLWAACMAIICKQHPSTSASPSITTSCCRNCATSAPVANLHGANPVLPWGFCWEAARTCRDRNRNAFSASGVR